MNQPTSTPFQSDKDLTPAQTAWNFIISALKNANRRGAFELEESYEIGTNLQVVQGFIQSHTMKDLQEAQRELTQQAQNEDAPAFSQMDSEQLQIAEQSPVDATIPIPKPTQGTVSEKATTPAQ